MLCSLEVCHARIFRTLLKGHESGCPRESGSCHAGELGLAEPRPPEGASEEVKKAFSANTAGINDILELRHISIASSHMADDDVDPEYVCPICLVSALCLAEILLHRCIMWTSYEKG